MRDLVKHQAYTNTRDRCTSCDRCSPVWYISLRASWASRAAWEPLHACPPKSCKVLSGSCLWCADGDGDGDGVMEMVNVDGDGDGDGDPEMEMHQHTMGALSKVPRDSL